MTTTAPPPGAPAEPTWVLELDEVEFQILWDQLDERERLTLARWLESQTPWRATPAVMANHLTKGRWKLWRYWRFLGQKFRDAVSGADPNQIWNVPSRHGKSLLASQWGPVWALDRDPFEKIILVSYADALALENAGAVLDILREYPDRLRAQLRQDRQRQDRFLTAEGGGILARGIRSGIAGYGASGLVVDDPYKNWQAAHSDANREEVDTIYRTVLRLRLEVERPWQVICHTRWHPKDLTESLINRMEDGTGSRWTLVRLPALAEPYEPDSPDRWRRMPDPLGREPGEPLGRFSVEEVRSRALDLGEYLAAAVEQQRPSPAEGGELKRAWWKIDEVMPAAADEWLSSWDMKLKEKETGDWTVGQVWGRTGIDLWLVDQFRGQWGQEVAGVAMALVTVRHPQCRRHLVENAGYGPEVMQSMRRALPRYELSDEIAGQLGIRDRDERSRVEAVRRRGLPGIIPVPVKGSKVVRARICAGTIEGGNVHLNARGDWLAGFLEETAAFPNGAHDDQVDTMSQAVSRMQRHGTVSTSGDYQRSARATSVG